MAEINDSNDFNFGIPLPPPVVRSHRADTRRIPMTYIPYIPTVPTHAGPSLLHQRGLWGLGNGIIPPGPPEPTSAAGAKVVRRPIPRVHIPYVPASPTWEVGPTLTRGPSLWGLGQTSTYDKYAVYMASGVLVAGVVAAILLLK